MSRGVASRIAALAVAALTVWVTVRYWDARAWSMPFLEPWAFTVASCAGAWWVAAKMRAWNPSTVGRAALLAAVPLASVGGQGLVARFAFHEHRLGVVESAAVVAVAAIVGAYLGRTTGRHPNAPALLAVEALATWPLLDAYLGMRLPGMYDFRVYLGGGGRFLSGGEPYLNHVMLQLPPGPAADAFLYPPVLLPAAAIASRLPYGVAWILWAAILVACGAGALRLLGFPWRWAVLFLMFPPLVKGIDSGNVANIVFLLFAAGPLAGAGLVAGGLFKVQSGIPALWLVRERRWRELFAGVGFVIVLAGATLPFVGLDSWRSWIAGLAYRAASQVNVPILYGLSLAQYVPTALFVIAAAMAIVAAILVRGRKGLAALGLATVIASPTLWPHGFLLALPAALALDATFLWPVLALAVGGAGLWALPLAGTLALVGQWDARPRSEIAHPLGSGGIGPWSGSATAWRADRG